VRYKSAIAKLDVLVTLVCIVLIIVNLGGLGSAGRERARRMVCASNMARLAQANHIYADNWDEQFCPPMMEDENMPETERSHCWVTNNNFRTYTALEGKQVEGSEYMVPKEYQCPTDILFKKGESSSWGVLASYAYNVSDWQGNPNPELSLNCYWNDGVGTCCSCEPQPWLVGHKRTAIENPSKKINFTDSGDWWCAWDGADYEEAWDIVGQGNWDDYEVIGIFGPVLYRHNEGANFAFYDGHVEYLPKEQAYVEQAGSNPPERDATGMWFVLEW
jgi:prepilin-type processing-associated H-X9-DG protein